MSTAGNRRRGNERELKAQRYLEKLGYFVHRAVQTGTQRPCKPCPRCKGSGRLWLSFSNDIFGLFDLLAVGWEHKPLMVQVTTSTSVSARRKALLEAAHHFNLSFVDVELWIYYEAQELYRAERLDFACEKCGGLRSELYESAEAHKASHSHHCNRAMFKKLGTIDMEDGDNGEKEELQGGVEGEEVGGEAGEEAREATAPAQATALAGDGGEDDPRDL